MQEISEKNFTRILVFENTYFSTRILDEINDRLIALLFRFLRGQN